MSPIFEAQNCVEEGTLRTPPLTTISVSMMYFILWVGSLAVTHGINNTYNSRGLHGHKQKHATPSADCTAYP